VPIYAEPPLVPAASRPVISDLVRDETGAASFTVTFAANQELPTHRNASRILLQVLEGSGLVTVAERQPVEVVAGDQVQVGPNAPHAVFAGAVGMLLQVHLVPDCCSRC
jgi:quercetin dioxygenase-like cupin family protein